MIQRRTLVGVVFSFPAACQNTAHFFGDKSRGRVRRLQFPDNLHHTFKSWGISIFVTYLILQIPKCIRQIFHNVFVTEMCSCAHFCHQTMHCGICETGQSYTSISGYMTHITTQTDKNRAMCVFYSTYCSTFHKLRSRIYIDRYLFCIFICSYVGLLLPCKLYTVFKLLCPKSTMWRFGNYIQNLC